MKYFFIIPFSILITTSFSFAVTCVDLEKDKSIQFEKLTAAKVRVLEQEKNLLLSIQNKKDMKKDIVDKDTSERIATLEAVIVELKDIKNPTRRIRSTIQTIEVGVDTYASGTVKALNIFDTNVSSILLERSKNIESIVETYTKDLENAYTDANTACKEGVYAENLLEESIKEARTKVIVGQKNTKRMTQGIEAAYGKLNFDLDTLDEDLKETLKTIRPVLRRELQILQTPLSSLRLIQM